MNHRKRFYFIQSMVDDPEKSRKTLFSSFRRRPESSISKWLQLVWTPVFTEETAFYKPVDGSSPIQTLNF